MLGHRQCTPELLFVDDAVDAFITAAIHDDPAPTNGGPCDAITLRAVPETIAVLRGFLGAITWDHTRLYGRPARRLDSPRAADEYPWRPKLHLSGGLRQTVDWSRRVGSRAAQQPTL